MPIRSLHAATVEALARWIVGGRYVSGSLLPNETDIGNELNVSRTVVREAVRTLVAKGMLATRRRLGTEVTPQAQWSMMDREVLSWRLRFAATPELIQDLYEFRMTVEIYAAERCARDPHFDRGHLLELASRLDSAADRGGTDWMAADLAFHRFLVQGAGNQFFTYMEPVLDSVFKVLLTQLEFVDGTIRDAIPDHHRVAQAIAAGDAAAAKAAMEALIHAGRTNVVELLISPDDDLDIEDPVPSGRDTAQRFAV